MTNQPNQAIVKSEPLHIFMQKPEVIEQMIGLFRDEQEAKRYMQSVIILVQNSDPGEYSLQNCSNESILRSALRAVSLRVSVDPAVRQAWLIPRKNNKSGKLEASLQLHYNEIRNRVMRTNLYQCVNVSPVYDGDVVMVDVYSGLHLIQLASGLLTSPEQTTRFVPVNERHGKVQGWLGYTKRIRGQEHTVYMSIEDIEKHVSTYNPYWSSSRAWKGDSRTVMEQKTVLLALLRKEDLGDPKMGEIKEILDEQPESESADMVDGELSYVDNPEYQDIPGSDSEPDKTPEEPEKVVTVSGKDKEKDISSATRPYPPLIFREKLLKAIETLPAKYQADGIELSVSDRERKVLADCIDKIFGDKGISRHPVCMWLVGHGSTSEMEPAQIKALFHVLGIKNTIQHPANFNDPPCAESIEEFKLAYAEATKR